MGRPAQMRICYICKEELPAKKMFTLNPYVCTQCLASGYEQTRKLYLHKCEQCGAEFSINASKSQKYCSNDCYKAYLNSDAHPRRKTSTSKKSASDKGIDIDDADDEALEAYRRRQNMSHVARCKATLKEFGDITKLCKELNISYGYYQQLKETNKLDEYIKSMTED